MEQLTDKDFEQIKKLTLEIAQQTAFSSRNILQVATLMAFTLIDKKKLAAYKSADEQGRLIVLPCKIGDAIYVIEHDCDDTCRFWNVDMIDDCPDNKCKRFGIKERTMSFSWVECRQDEFGKTIFPTYEEAEAALNAMLIQADPHTIQVPYQARLTAIDLLRKELYADFMVLNKE